MTNNSLHKPKGDKNSLIANFKKSDPIQQKLDNAEARIALLEQKCSHKDKILAVLAHDLRSPLSSISGLISVFEGKDAQRELELHVSELKTQLISVNELMNNLLRWASHSFEDAYSSHATNIDAASILRLNMELLDFVAKEKNIQLINTTTGPIELFVNQDQVDIILRNLLLNAVKFTGSGGTITISSQVNNNNTEITITDTGVGMSPQQLGTLFSSTHFSNYGTSGEKGFGLGLLLCKEYLDINNGTITITSELNKGTAITIMLPSAINDQ
ncbi:hypothetical protein CJD36_021800 [Flavipsychrobacter stenotrophus]|uniref:histidine kinase n=1 Tax=Flavipsychrobacter stenotrophus TaxID=2077091 RepID=A0A2S7SQN0_9BACT|nr:HAMP domain-containing sensor histidine kinase [Flavipsychrobacter stenotrophus]PQJ08905.1 hypothetical protein CJD36_021800 [Flavipsychrobacter stenotrophus]